jgi:hypothetical protein
MPLLKECYRLVAAVTGTTCCHVRQFKRLGANAAQHRRLPVGKQEQRGANPPHSIGGHICYEALWALKKLPEESIDPFSSTPDLCLYSSKKAERLLHINVNGIFRRMGINNSTASTPTTQRGNYLNHNLTACVTYNVQITLGSILPKLIPYCSIAFLF